MKKTVALDKPCRVCGKPIHYSYSGPIEGVCGRCTDAQKSKRRPPMRRRGYHRAMVVDRGAGKERSPASSVMLILTIVAVGGAAVAMLLHKFLG